MSENSECFDLSFAKAPSKKTSAQTNQKKHEKKEKWNQENQISSQKLKIYENK
jgi:hypothetical protein